MIRINGRARARPRVRLRLRAPTSLIYRRISIDPECLEPVIVIVLVLVRRARARLLFRGVVRVLVR